MKAAVASTLIRAAVLATLITSSAAVAQSTDDLNALDLQSLMQMDITLVTAQKRIENADRVPISMWVIKRDVDHGIGVSSSMELQQFVPGLTTTGAVSLVTPFIRGVGTDVLTSGIEPSVAMYVDGVYQGDRAKTFVDMADVEQIEVLRGPQGTLYGRNATGGAINITTRGPTDTFVASSEISAGNLNLRDASAFVAGPLADSLKVSLSAHMHDRDGIYKNLVTGERVEDDSFYGVNGRAVLELSPSFSAEVLAKYFSRDNTAGYATHLTTAIPELMGYQVGKQPWEVASNGDSNLNRLDSTSVALKLTWEGQWARLQSISANQVQRHYFGADLDASTGTLAEFSVRERYSAFTQEFQLTPAQAGERWDWLVGAFFLDGFAGMSPIASESTVPGLGVITQEARGDLATTAYAAFGEATFKLTREFSVTGGLRMSYEEQRLNDVSAGIVGLSSMSFPPRSEDWHDLSYRLIAKYSLDRAFLYAKAESGFKSGAFNNTNPLKPGPVDPEQIKAYEVGIKTAFPRASLHLTMDVFYNDYRDLQIMVFDAETHSSSMTQAPKAETYGAEASAEWNVSERWNITAGAAWLHAAYREFTSPGFFVSSPFGGNIPIGTVDLSGNRLSRSPDFTGTFGTSYKVPTVTGDWVGSADYYYSSRIYYEPTNAFSQAPYGLLDASLRYNARAGWSVSLWGRNLTDEAYCTLIVPNELSTAGEFAAPRTYGISASYSFGK